MAALTLLSLAQGHLSCPQYRFHQIVEDGLLARQNADYRSHAREYLQRVVLGAKVAAIAPNPDQVKTIPVLIGDRIGTNVREFSRQPPVDP